MTLLVLSSIQVRTFANIVTGIRDTTGKWTMFTVIIGILTFLVPPIWILYAFFAFIDGIATAVDARSCFTVSLGRKTPYLAPCHQMRAISALIWLSILFGCLHLYSMLWLNAYLKRLKRKIRVRNNRGWHTRFWTEGRVEFALGYSKFSLWLLPQMVGMKSAVIRYIRKRVFKR